MFINYDICFPSDCKNQLFFNIFCLLKNREENSPKISTNYNPIRTYHEETKYLNDEKIGRTAALFDP